MTKANLFWPIGVSGSLHKTIQKTEKLSLKRFIGSHYDANGTASTSGLEVEPFGGKFLNGVGRHQIKF